MLVPGIGWPGGSLENSGIIVGVITGAYLGAIWLAAVIWTARDIRDRSHDSITRSVAVLMVLMLNLPGWVLYRVLRPPLTLADLFERELEEEALLQDLNQQMACPECSAQVQEDYVVCPHCACRLKEPCGQCQRALALSWSDCPWCGRQRSRAAPLTAPEVTPSVAAAQAVPSRRPRAIAAAERRAPADAVEVAAEQTPFRRPHGGEQAPSPPARTNSPPAVASAGE